MTSPDAPHLSGLHLTADLHGCSAGAPMHDADALRGACLRAVAAAGLTAVHTWPEERLVTVDAFVCNLHHDNRERASALMDAVEALFGAARIERRRIERSVA